MQQRKVIKFNRMSITAGMVLWLAFLAVAPAYGAALPQPELVPGLFWTATFLAAFFIIIAAWALLRLARLKVYYKDNSARAIQNLAFLSSGPDSFLAWDHKGNFLCGDKLVDWLRIQENVARYSDLEERDDRAGGIPREDFQRLSLAIARLREKAEPFPASFELVIAGRVMSVFGQVLSDIPQQNHTSGRARPCIVWFRDITYMDARLAASERMIKDTTGTADRLTETLTALDVPVWRRDADLKLVWVNPAYVRIVEAEDAETVLENQIELISNALAGNLGAVLKTLGSRQRICVEKHYIVVDGQRRAMNITHVSASRGSTIGYAVDVGEAEEARSELARYVEAHAETLNKLSTAVAIFASDKTLEYFNSAFAKFWGLSESYLSDHPHHSELLEEMREKRLLPEQANFPAWKQGQIDLYRDLIEAREEMWHLPNASTLRVVFQPHPMGGLLVFFEDVTDSLALERSYNTLFAVQKATLNNLHEAVAVFGSDGQLKLYNPAFCRIWHLEDEFLSGNPHISAVAAECSSFFDKEREGIPLGVETISEDDHRVVKSGRHLRLDDSVIDYTSVPLPDGATLLTYEDVTDSIRIERALRERNEALEAADRLKTEFIAHVSYELRNPLNSVTGFAELLEQEYYGPLNEQQHAYTRHILESSGQLMLLINDILDLSVIEAGRMKLEISDVDIIQMIRDITSLVQEEAQRLQLTIRIDVPKTMKPIAADEKRLRQIVYNLVNNALKFTPAGGEVTIGVSSSAKNIVLSVTDTGIGIPLEEQRLVFDSFNTGKTQKGQGGGLGLSLVRRFTELHGGAIELISDPGAGTCVTCTLPRRDLKSSEGGESGRGHS